MTGAVGPEHIPGTAEFVSRNQVKPKLAEVGVNPNDPSVPLNVKLDISKPTASKLKPGEVEFHGEASRGIFQLTNPLDIKDPLTGVRTSAKPKKLVLEYGRAVTSDVEIIHRVKGCPESCGKHLAPNGEPCGPHPQYGLGKAFWDAEEASQKGEEKRLSDAVNAVAGAIESDPSMAELILARLGAKGFELPPRPKAGQESRQESTKDKAE